MAFDQTTGHVVLFGGTSNGGGGLSDTWVRDGSLWTRLDAPHNPSVRFGAPMAFDPTVGGLVLFGGSSYGGTGDLSDTWVFDGTDWTQLNPAHHPSARAGSSLAFDPISGKLVLFGGFAGASPASDTWAFDGTDWTQEETDRALVGQRVRAAAAGVALSSPMQLAERAGRSGPTGVGVQDDADEHVRTGGRTALNEGRRSPVGNTRQLHRAPLPRAWRSTKADA